MMTGGLLLIAPGTPLQLLFGITINAVYIMWLISFEPFTRMNVEDLNFRERLVEYGRSLNLQALQAGSLGRGAAGVLGVR